MADAPPPGPSGAGQPAPPEQPATTTTAAPTNAAPHIPPSDLQPRVTDQALELDQDANSSFGDDYTSETTSLASSIYHHQFENGRSYHSYKAGKYLLPNDEKENDRLDMHHHIQLLHTGGELYFAPIGDDPERILDLGTGTGVWAMDIGDKFPNATVQGVDLSPSQPKWIPPNVQFEIDDIEEEWTYSKPFDFIHLRYLSGALRDWQKLADQCFKHTKPGGWTEFKDLEVNPYTHTGSRDLDEGVMKQWHVEVLGACEAVGLEHSPGPILKQVLEKAGFVNVQERVYANPSGGWPKDPKLKLIGKFYGVTLDEGAAAITMRIMTQVKGWSAEEVNVFVAKIRDSLKKYPFYHKYYIAWGQKPENASAAVGGNDTVVDKPAEPAEAR